MTQPPIDISALTPEKIEAIGKANLYDLVRIAETLNTAAALIHKFNEKWWRDLETNEPIKRNVGEMLMLVVTEIAEGMEGHRKNRMDDHLPQHPMLTVEIADAVIRELDICGGLHLNLGQAFFDKTIYNLTRKDHTREARRAEGGKKV